jgi:AcrR family transcriptional regulator
MSGGGPARSRELRKQGKETLRRLLEAAIVVFDERGYSGARIDDIVKEANTSHGTFYLYFANKEDLFQALVSGVTDQMHDLAESLPSIKASKEGFDELREWLGRFYDLYDHYHPVIRAWTDINTQNSDMARTGAVVLRRFTDQLVRRVREIHPPPVSDPETAALAMVSMIERATFYAVVRLVPVDRDALLDNLATILHVGLFAGSRRRRPPGPRR